MFRRKYGIRRNDRATKIKSVVIHLIYVARILEEFVKEVGTKILWILELINIRARCRCFYLFRFLTRFLIRRNIAKFQTNLLIFCYRLITNNLNISLYFYEFSFISMIFMVYTIY